MSLDREVLKEGAGSTPQAGDTVTVHCTGYLKDTMQKFWSTKDPGQTSFSFCVGQGRVIRGWDEGILQMKVGESARLTMSSEYAYGSRGFPAWKIPPNAALVFDIELLSKK